MRKSEVFRELLQGQGMIVAPGAYDALTAKLIAAHGFGAVYVTGFGVSAALLGRPDLGLISLGEMVGHLGRINAAVGVPVIADADSGFGNALNVMRTVELYEQIGIAALHIEDQLVPKWHKPDGMPQVCSCEDHCEKIRAAVAARTDDSLCNIARTDALQRHGIREAVRRAQAYGDAGADMIFVHGASERADLEVIVREVPTPNLVNYSTLRESGATPMPSMDELAEMGFRVCIAAGEGLFCAARAVDQYLAVLKEHGTLPEAGYWFMPFERFSHVLGMDRYVDLERAHLPERPDSTYQGTPCP